MILLTAQNLVKEYNGEALFKPINFSLDEGERVAIIGANGCGKSTLIKMLIGELNPDGGVVSLNKHCTIGYLSQHVISSEANTLYLEAESVFKDLMRLEEELFEICKRIETDPHNEELLRIYAEKENTFSLQEGYNYRYKIKMILNYFNFKEADYLRPISSFSGGEKMKIAFAKLLLLKPNVLILDEPTNHLDISTIEWLETYLKTYQGSILFVSHDRYFINAITTKVYEMEAGNFEVYVGNYDRYCAEKKQRYETRLKLYKKEEAQKQKLEWFIRFYMPKPRFVSRAHDREKKLAKLESKRIEKPLEAKNHVHINFSGQLRNGKRVFEVKDLSIGYEKDSPLVEDINFLFLGGNRLAIMGENGSGKSTFIKTLLGIVKPLKGHINHYDDFNIGYLPQDGLLIQSQSTVYDYFKDLFPQVPRQEILNHLGAFDFSFEDDQKCIDALSGGEKMRIVLAKLVLENYDILVLDEPTNHLDMMTKNELTEAISRYKGSLIIISHDRSFVDEITDHLLYFENHKAYYFTGDYSHFKVEKLDEIYSEKEAIRQRQEEEIRQKEEENRNQRLAVRALEKNEAVKKPRPSLAKNKIEEKLARLERVIEELAQKLDDPDFYHDQNKLVSLQDEIFENNREYERMFEMLSLYDE